MDKREPIEEVTEELARELLIAISCSVPEKVFDTIPYLSCKILTDVNGTLASNGDLTDSYRSQLISLSNVQSPDVNL